MARPGDLLRRKLLASNTVLFVATAGLTIGVLAYLENHRPSLQGPSFVRYLAESRIEGRSFKVNDDNNLVPNPELYEPFPESRGLLSVPQDFLIAVRRYEKTCREVDYKSAESSGRALALTPSKLLDWHRSVCTRNFANFHLWLDRAPYLHPSGVSYAKLFALAQPDDPAAGNDTFLHVRERTRLAEFDQWYLGLTLDEQKTFLSGFQAAAFGPELAVAGDWDGKAREISVLPLAAVNQDLRENFALELAPSRQSPHCEFQQFGLCFAKASGSLLRWKRQWTFALLLALMSYAALAGALSYLLWRQEGRRRNAEQALLFQVISHELRTPMTVMKLSTDGLRQQFDRLDDKGQQNVLKILDGFSDLEKIVTRTLKEIKGENEPRVFDLAQATSAIIEAKYPDLVRFDEPEQPVLVRFSDFWFEICLTNLIRNALLHGQKPVVVRVSHGEGRIQVEVEDAGKASLKEVRSFARPFARNKSKLGLGIGLRIVARKMKEAGGTLIAQASPTRYVLQFAAVEEK